MFQNGYTNTLNHLLLSFFLLFGVVFVPGEANAVDPVVLIEANAPFDLARHAEYLIEPRELAHQFEERLHLPELVSHWQRGQFQPVTTRQIGFGVQWSLVHIRVPIANPDNQPRTWMLAFNRWAGTFNSVSLVIEGEPLPAQPIAQTLHLLDWTDNDVIYHTPFTLPANSTGALYVSYSNGASSAPMTIETVDSYNDRRRVEDIYFFFFVALVLGVGLLVTLQMAALGQYTAYFYLAYLISILAWQGSETEYLYRPLLFEAMPWINQIGTILWATSIGLLFLFQRSFLHIEHGGKIWRRCLIGLFLWAMATGFIYLITDMRYHFAAYATGSLLHLLAPISGIIAIRQRLQGAWPFFVGASIVSSVSILFVVSNLFSATLRPIDGRSLMSHAVLIEAILFAYAMFRQTRAVRDEKEHALQAELKATREKLQLHEQLVTTAHDIQQPLTALKLASDNKKLGNAVDYLQDIVQRNLNSNVSDSARSNDKPDDDHTHHASHIDEEAAESFDASLILQNVTAMFSEEARVKGLALNTSEITQQVYASPLVLMRIVSNLVSNAIKNTDKGQVSLTCHQQHHSVRIDVQDTGCGLSSEQIQRLQEPYQRDGEYEGTGLGLSIVQQLCATHGYGFTIQSTPGEGSVFSVNVPLTVESTVP